LGISINIASIPVLTYTKMDTVSVVRIKKYDDSTHHRQQLYGTDIPAPSHLPSGHQCSHSTCSFIFVYRLMLILILLRYYKILLMLVQLTSFAACSQLVASLIITPLVTVWNLWFTIIIIRPIRSCSIWNIKYFIYIWEFLKSNVVKQLSGT